MTCGRRLDLTHFIRLLSLIAQIDTTTWWSAPRLLYTRYNPYRDCSGSEQSRPNKRPCRATKSKKDRERRRANRDARNRDRLAKLEVAAAPRSGTYAKGSASGASQLADATPEAGWGISAGRGRGIHHDCISALSNNQVVRARRVPVQDQHSMTCDNKNSMPCDKRLARGCVRGVACDVWPMSESCFQ